MSSSKRDQENNSEFDKYESLQTKADDSKYLAAKAGCASVMKDIEYMYGPFTEDEIHYYMRELARDKNTDSIINGFQKSLIFNLFYKHFGDPQVALNINIEDYIKLMIAAKRLLRSYNMVYLPSIVSAKINKVMSRKNINKKELTRIESSPNYAYIESNYTNANIKEEILNKLAIILSSDFQLIEYDEDIREYTGYKLTIDDPACLFDELLVYVRLVNM